MVEALSAYGRAGLACRQGLDAWTVEPEGARIALAVRKAVGADTHPAGVSTAECDLRCSVRGEDDPCRDW